MAGFQARGLFPAPVRRDAGSGSARPWSTTGPPRCLGATPWVENTFPGLFFLITAPESRRRRRRPLASGLTITCRKKMYSTLTVTGDEIFLDIYILLCILIYTVSKYVAKVMYLKIPK
jgi:hypothetical protein